LDRYFSSGANVYYSRQLEILMEEEFFHWITGRALNELAGAGKIGFTAEVLPNQKAGPTPAKAHFYYPVKHRYQRRQIREIMGLIAEFSAPEFTRAVGHYGELLVESGFAQTGFRILQRKVKAIDGKLWTESNHDLDFLVERDGVRYGVEVKNQLGYIDQTEFQKKLAMCGFFGVRPMFVCRKIPGNYFYEIYQAGGFSMMTDNQNYPLLANDLAKRVRQRLRLPVRVIERLPNTALVRFERFHMGVLGGGNV
jgi:hypothetical protein